MNGADMTAGAPSGSDTGSARREAILAAAGRLFALAPHAPLQRAQRPRRRLVLAPPRLFLRDGHDVRPGGAIIGGPPPPPRRDVQGLHALLVEAADEVCHRRRT